MHHSAVITGSLLHIRNIQRAGDSQGTENMRPAVFLHCVQYRNYDSAVRARKMCHEKTRTPGHAEVQKYGQAFIDTKYPARLDLLLLSLLLLLVLYVSNIKDSKFIC
jgi:hypothetical protein